MRGTDVLLDIDVQGAARLRELARNDPEFGRTLEFVFIAPPSFGELEKRLRGRGSETEESLARRLSNARMEMERAKEYEYLIVNDDLAAAAERFLWLIRSLRLSVKRLNMEKFPS